MSDPQFVILILVLIASGILLYIGLSEISHAIREAEG